MTSFFVYVGTLLFYKNLPFQRHAGFRRSVIKLSCSLHLTFFRIVIDFRKYRFRKKIQGCET